MDRRGGPGAGAASAAGRWRMPLLQGILPLDKSRIGHDLVAGVTLAALGIPGVMGYTKISGTPVVTGPYILLLPIVVFALIGGSRNLVVAADSATAAILASMLVTIAAFGSPDSVGLTSLVALAVACMLLLARVFRLGFLADFLSRSALIGFLTGVGVQVAGGEIGGPVGLDAHLRPRDGALRARLRRSERGRLVGVPGRRQGGSPRGEQRMRCRPDCDALAANVAMQVVQTRSCRPGARTPGPAHCLPTLRR
jgi:hypothetical protein